MKYWLKFLPFLGIPLIRIAEVDTVVIPALLHYFSFWTTVILASIVATAELIYIYFIVGRIEKLAQEAAKKMAAKVAQNNPEFARHVVVESKGIAVRAKHLGITIYDFALDKYRGLVELAKTTIFPILQRGGYFAIFMIGLIPESGFRVGGAIFCQITNSRRSLVALLIGNVCKTMGMVKLWEFLSFLPLWLRFIIVIGSLVILWLLAKLFIKKKPPV